MVDEKTAEVVLILDPGQQKILTIFITDTDSTAETVATHQIHLAGRRQNQHWNAHKTEPAFEDILAELRGTLVVERITGAFAPRPAPHEYRDHELACAAAAAYSNCETHRE